MGQQEPQCDHSDIRVTLEIETSGRADHATKMVTVEPGPTRHWVFICNQCDEEQYDLGVANWEEAIEGRTPETAGATPGATPAPGTSAGEDMGYEDMGYEDMGYVHVDSEAVLKAFRELRPDLKPSYEYPGFFSVDIPGTGVCVAFGDANDKWGANYTDAEGEGWDWGGWEGDLSVHDRDPQWVAAELAKACDPKNLLRELRSELVGTRKRMETAVSLEREEELNEEEGLLVKAITALEGTKI